MAKSKNPIHDGHGGIPAGGHSPRFGKGGRDLLYAATLRPAEVYLLYGMPVTTVTDLCLHPDPDKRIESYKVPGRRGRKGSRYIDHVAFKAWLAKWRKKEGAT